MNTRMNHRSGPAGASRGFVMLEALVGLLIFSIGILGIVGVQASMTKAQTMSKFRSDAASLAGEIVGTMWSDVANVPQYDAATCSSYARCKDWSDKVAALLPGGTPTIAVVGTALNGASAAITITITWTAPNETVPARYVTATSIGS